MNLKISFWVSLLLFPVAALAEPSSVLLSGTTVSTGEVTVLRQASVLLDDGHTKIDAGQITMEQLGKQLECANGETVTVSGHTMKSDHLTITLEPHTRVFFFNPSGVAKVDASIADTAATVLTSIGANLAARGITVDETERTGLGLATRTSSAAEQITSDPLVLSLNLDPARLGPTRTK